MFNVFNLATTPTIASVLAESNPSLDYKHSRRAVGLYCKWNWEDDLSFP